MRYEVYAKKLAEDYLKNGIIDGKNFPDIELYIDQMVQSLNKELRLYGEGKEAPITKAMISNYTKHRMIPGPVGKRYTKDHLIFMTLVFYLKNCFSMEEIRRLMKPLLDNYSSSLDEPIDFVAMYGEIIDFVRRTEADLPRRLEEQMSDVKQFLAKRDAEDDDTSELMMLITTLVMRSNAERFIAGKLLDEYFENLKKGGKKK